MKDCDMKMKLRDEEDKKALIVRINKILGQMNGIKKMIDNNRYCGDILIQLSAIDRSIKSLADVILEDHMKSCLVEDIKNNNTEAVDEILDLFKKFR